MKISTIIGFIILCLIVLLISNLIIYSMAKSICLEKNTIPIRWESKGLLGTLTAIPTTKENMDEMGKICIRTGEPSFLSLSQNVEFIIKNINKTK